MARSGSLAALEQRLAAQRREDDRLARERRQRDNEQERLRQQEHRESQQQAADEKTAALQERMKALDEVLTSVLPLRPLSFDRLMAVPRTPEFDPGPLGFALPHRTGTISRPSRRPGFGRLLGVTGRPGRQMTEARARFEAAQAEHLSRTAERRRALAVAKARYDRKVTEERAKAVARNAYVTSRQSAFAAGDAEAVQWFVDCVLRASKYPDGFPREYQVAYRPEHREVTVDFELPPRRVVPAARAYRYVKARDVIEPVPRRKARSASVTNGSFPASRFARCTRYSAPPRPTWCRPSRSPAGSAPSTGPRVIPCAPSCSAFRPSGPRFDALVLDTVDPAACLARLNALVSPG